MHSIFKHLLIAGVFLISSSSTPALGKSQPAGINQAEIHAYAEANFKTLLLTQTIMVAYVVYSACTTISYLAKLLSFRKISYLRQYSDQSAQIAPLSQSCQANFTQLEEVDFHLMINDLLMHTPIAKEAEIRSMLVRSYNLYQFPNFVACIKDWPEYAEHLQEIQASAKKDAGFKKLLLLINTKGS